MKKSFNNINIKLIIGSLFLVAGISSYSAENNNGNGKLNTNFAEKNFSEDKSKSLNQIVDDNTSSWPLSWTRPLIKKGVESAITSATSSVPIIGQYLPNGKSVMDYNFYHYKESNGKEIADNFNKTNKMVNDVDFMATVNKNEISRLSTDTNKLKMESQVMNDDLKKLSHEVDKNKQIGDMKTQAFYDTLNKKIDEEATERDRIDNLIIADIGRVENKVENNTTSINNLDKKVATNKTSIENLDKKVTMTAKKDRKEVQKNFKNLSEAVQKDIAKEAAARKASDMAIMNEVQNVSSHVENNTRAIENLNKKVTSGLAAVAAMTTIDNISSGRAGDVNIGAAVGGFEGTQAVAVGVAFSPTDNLSLVTKVGLNPGRSRYTTYGAGVNYRFNINR